MNWQLVLAGAISITGFIEWIKSFDKEKKLKKYYKFLPLILAIAPAVFISYQESSISWSYILFNWMLIFSFSVIGYDNIIDTIQKKIKT